MRGPEGVPAAAGGLKARLLRHQSPFVRKGTALALRPSRALHRIASKEADHVACPPVICNSFPKSGTHLLLQILQTLPRVRNYGTFLASMTSSRRFRERSLDSTLRIIAACCPGELVPAHLFFDEPVAKALGERGFVHFIIVRDPRDVVVSEAYYLTSMNRWHRLHKYFRNARSDGDRILLSIDGLPRQDSGIEYPNVAARFARYAAWLDADETCVVRYEELMCADARSSVERIVNHWAAKTGMPADLDATVDGAVKAISPTQSHTFRKGRIGEWEQAFTSEARRRMKDVAGDLLVQLGYESDVKW